MLRKAIALWILLTTVSAGYASANPDAVVFDGGDVRISGTGNGLVFPDGSVQGKAQVEGPAGPQGPVGPQGPPGPLASNVTIAGTAKVSDVDNPGRNAFQFTFNISTNQSGTFYSFTVPAGKRLVIEYVDAYLPADRALFTASFFTIYLTTTVNGNTASYIVNRKVNASTLPADTITPSLVKIYADPNTPVTVSVEFSGLQSGIFNSSVKISGHFVTL